MSKLHLDLSTELYHTPLNLKVLLNDDVLLSTVASENEYNLTADLDNKTEYCLRIVIDGKTNQHSKVEQNKMVSSAQIILEKLMIDTIDIKHIIQQSDKCMSYKHNTNNNTDEIVEEFYNDVFGYNGTVEIKFYMPIKDWFLETIRS